MLLIIPLPTETAENKHKIEIYFNTIIAVPGANRCYLLTAMIATLLKLPLKKFVC
jgi:hypothetical protein